MSRKAVYILIALAVAALSAFPACSKEGPQRPVKVIMIGVDGATWSIIDPMMKAGRLPNMKALAEGGVRGDLESIRPMNSPEIWTTIATGKLPDRHGIKGFVVKVPGRYETVPASSASRKVQAVWDILSEKAKKVGVLNWWASWPAEKVNGFVVSNSVFFQPILSSVEFYEESGTKGSTYPEGLIDEIKEVGRVSDADLDARLRRFGVDPATLTKAADRESARDEVEVHEYMLKNQVLSDESCRRAGLELYRKQRPDFFGIYFEGTDVMSHFFWKYMPSEAGQAGVPAAEAGRYGGIIPGYYEYMDEIVGEFMKAADDDTVIMVVSDHGFKAQPGSMSRVFDLNFVLERLGYQKRPGGKTDWKGTKAFNIDTNENWERKRDVYINVRGREAEGIVAPGDAASVAASLAASLRKVVTARGVPVFKSVEVTAPGGEEGGPDVSVEINLDTDPADSLVIGGKTYPADSFVKERHMSAGHDVMGVFMASGRAVKKGGVVKAASVKDITPTVLVLLGVPSARDMDGRPLTDIMTPGFLKSNPPSEVDTYEKAGGRPAAQRPAALDEGAVKKLKSLGYIQ